MRTLVALALFLSGCSCGDGGPGDAPALHRLTTHQLNRTLADLFEDDALPQLVLPEDVPVHGFDNNALTRDATPYLVESLQRGLAEVVAAEVADGGPWLSCDTCGADALDTLLPRAWRRPVTDDERAWVQQLYTTWRAELDDADALQLTLLVVLQSPDFLYLVEHGEGDGDVRQLTDHELASRLSYLLWDTMPDETLRALADAGQLRDRDVLRQQAERLLADPRGAASIVRFHAQWLGLDRVSRLEPDFDTFAPVLFTEDEYAYAIDALDSGDPDALRLIDEEWGRMSARLQRTYTAEFEQLVEREAFGAGTLDALLTTRHAWVSERTARLYGVEPTGEPVVLGTGEAALELYEVELPPEQRAGVLTRGAFLAGHAHPTRPSPVLRGVFVRERLLCLPRLAPPDDVPPLSATVATEATTNRERYAAHTAEEGCASCHEAIDGVGFPFEHYDAVGAWRDLDHGQPVDATGQLVGTDVDGPVTDAIDLVEALAGSRMVHDCAVTNLYRYGMHRTESAGDADAIDALQHRFWKDGGDIRALLLAFVTSEAFGTRRVP